MLASGSSGRRMAGSCTRWDAGSRAASTVKTAGSSSYSTFTRRAASSAASLVSAATAATGSPWYLTSPTASTGRSSAWGPNRGTGCGRSAAVITRRTPGTASAAVLSMEMRRARAASMVTNLAWRTSVSLMSATYSWAPVTRPSPPARGRDAPIAWVVIVPPPRRRPGRLRRSARTRRTGTGCRPGPRGCPRASGCGLRARRACADISWPGMQKPHWAAPWSRKACCSGLRCPSVANPSTVRISDPSASAASIRQEFTVRPSTMTVQAPHSPTTQHSLVPVRPRSSRSTSSSVWWTATSRA